jgi:hypothetical protein
MWTEPGIGGVDAEREDERQRVGTAGAEMASWRVGGWERVWTQRTGEGGDLRNGMAETCGAGTEWPNLEL